MVFLEKYKKGEKEKQKRGKLGRHFFIHEFHELHELKKRINTRRLVSLYFNHG
jgi:hypothetical protein